MPLAGGGAAVLCVSHYLPSCGRWEGCGSGAGRGVLGVRLGRGPGPRAVLQLLGLFGGSAALAGQEGSRPTAP